MTATTGDSRQTGVHREVVQPDRSAPRLRLEPGQAVVIDNRRVLPNRTGFTDTDDPQSRRELLCVWLRRERG